MDEIRPLLVLWDSQTQHRLAGYVTEILQVEGYNWFAVHDLSQAPLTEEQLAHCSCVLLAHVEPSLEVQSQVLAYVRRGGALIAFRPPEALAAALGLAPVHRDIVDRYLSFHRRCALNAGVDVPPLQFHGRAELYLWPGDPSQVLAYFAAFPDLATPHPAIAVGALGQGHWAVFAYDLAESTVLFHQGRREQASTGPHADADGDRMYKPDDLFVGYLDPALGMVPQADLHQDVLVRLIDWLASLSQPLPRLWYFPAGANAVAFINGDGDAMTAADFDNVIATVDRWGVPYTAYLMLDDHPKVAPALAGALRQRGHDFGQHVWAGPRPTLEEMRTRLRQEVGAFRDRYGHQPETYRGHSRIWVGWTQMAQYLHEQGIRLDTNFAPGRYGRAAYSNGSGLPVKFMDDEGRVLDVYEQTTLSTDDGYTTDKTFSPALTVDECIRVSERQIDEAAERYHTVYHPYFHPVRTRPGPLSTQRWLEGVLAHGRRRGLYFVNGSTWVRFNDGRRAVRLVDYRFDVDDVTLDLSLRADRAVEGATLALPATFQGRALRAVDLDGSPVEAASRLLEGRWQVPLSADYVAGCIRRWHIEWGAPRAGRREAAALPGFVNHSLETSP
jgi:hypothetical protein